MSLLKDKTKICKTCRAEKPLDDFSPSRGTINGRLGTCRKCWSTKKLASYKLRVAAGLFGLCENCAAVLSRSPRGRKLPLCKNCMKGKLSPHWKGGHVSIGGYKLLKVSNRNVFEHRIVMEKYLGRKLYPDENVHHINGDKLDNCMDNLELWSVSQPPGQRVVDKIAWAKKILERYE